MLNVGGSNYIDGYFGDRYSSSAYSGGYSSYGNTKNTRVASSANLNRVSKDLSEGYGSDIDVMSDNFNEGNTTQALKLYQELFENAKDTAMDYGYELTDSQIRSSIDKAFQNRTGMKLTDEISAHGTSSFITGLLEGIPILGWFGANANSKAEARATVQGRQVGGLETAKEVAGATVSTSAGILGLGLAAGSIPASGVYSAFGIKGIATLCANLLAKSGIAAAGATVSTAAVTSALPIIAVGAGIALAVVLGKQYLANKAS